MKKSVLCLFLFLGACTTRQSDHPIVKVQTEDGDFEVELYTDHAPVSAGAFLANVKSGLYKNATFYRVLNMDNQPSNAPKAELIQGGIWRSNYRKAISLPTIPHETTAKTHILHKNGTVSFARGEPGTAMSEFFVCIGDQPGFDFGGENNPDGQGYAAFGKVIGGMDVVLKIYHRSESDQVFSPQVHIYDIITK